MFESFDELTDRIKATGYFIDPVMTRIVFLAAKLQKPLLLEGPAGSGKYVLGRSLPVSEPTMHACVARCASQSSNSESLIKRRHFCGRLKALCKLTEFVFCLKFSLDTDAQSDRVQGRLMKTELAFWRGPTVPAALRSIQLRQLFTRCCLMSAAILCLSAFQHEAQAQTVISQCTNPVCTPGKACAMYRCADPRPCLDCASPPSSGTSCEVGYALGDDANFAGGNIPDVLIESTDYWTIDDSGDVWYDGSSTTGPVQVTAITLPPSCIQTSGSFVLEDPIAEYEGSITVATFTYEGLETQYYAWPRSRPDTKLCRPRSRGLSRRKQTEELFVQAVWRSHKV